MQLGLWIRKNKSGLYILLVLLASFKQYLANLTRATSPNILALMDGFSNLAVFIILGLVVVLCCSSRTLKQSIEMAVVLLLSSFIGAQNGFIYMVPFFLFAYASLDIDLNKLIKWDLGLRLGMILFANILAWQGISQDVLIYRYDSMGGIQIVRHSFGFYHPNMLMVMVLFVILEWMYLRYRRLVWWEIAILTGITLYYNYLTNSRTSTMLALLAIFGCYILQLLNQHAPKVDQVIRRILNTVLRVFVPLVAVIDVFIMYLPKSSTAYIKLNGLLANRVDIGQFYLKQT
ncbi:hypothetical protein OXT66_07770 [Lentilactobacillus senioris]|uniref:hypothetical protein n=1 Tax=Lentilactobacillus senioris TaxID=931534 RepID=UPI002281AD4F|nr:hypothetical protein [Lentilactobacillus senioris]MCY9807429.1 hypothetical protein [Lentilactobacillus senioris]